MSSHSGVQSVRTVSIEGGTPTPLTNRFADPGFEVSPNGASRLFASQEGQRWPGLVVCQLLGCTEPCQVLRLGSYGGAGRRPVAGLSTLIPRRESNLWLQWLDGGSPRKLTHFSDGRTIGDFAWSRIWSYQDLVDPPSAGLLCCLKLLRAQAADVSVVAGAIVKAIDAVGNDV